MSGIDQSFLTMGKKRGGGGGRKRKERGKRKRRRKRTLGTCTVAFNSWIALRGNQPVTAQQAAFVSS